MRIGWDEYFLEISKAVSLRGDCTRSQVGSVLVGTDHRIISTGYNGVASGLSGCLSGACPRGRLSYEQLPPEGSYDNCISTHAERNAILYADVSRRMGSTIYITRSPCTGCKQLLLAEGVARVVWFSSDNKICSETLYE